MLIIELNWVPFCENGWTATDGKNEHAVLMKVENKWYIDIANFNGMVSQEEQVKAYDTFREARDEVCKRLGIQQATRSHLQALFAAGYRRT